MLHRVVVGFCDESLDKELIRTFHLQADFWVPQRSMARSRWGVCVQCQGFPQEHGRSCLCAHLVLRLGRERMDGRRGAVVFGGCGFPVKALFAYGLICGNIAFNC